MIRPVRVLFVLPRADWIASNGSLITTLDADPDFEVALVAPSGYRPSFAFSSRQLIEYPFYGAAPQGSVLARCRGHLAGARERRRLVDRAFHQFQPHCIVVISDTSRELMPFVHTARRRGVLVVYMQSVFLAASVRRHVRSENWTMLRRRGVSGLADLVAVRLLQAIGGLPGTLLKSPAMGARSDIVFAINRHQRDVLTETVPPDRIEATGTPFLDFLHHVVEETPQRTERRAFCRSLGVDPERPIAVYFSKSLEQFCQAAPEFEREVQESFVDGFLDRFETATLVVKLHPIEDDRAFRKFASNPRVRIVKETDVHELIYHSALVISIGPSTPAFHAVFHDRARLLIVQIGNIALDFQRDLMDVSVCVRSRDEYRAALDELKLAGWPRNLPERFGVAQRNGLGKFMEGFDGGATVRTRARLRELLGLTAA